MGSGRSARKRSRSSTSLYGIGADLSAHLGSKEKPGHNRIVWLISENFGVICGNGGGGNRTRVRERSARESTYLSGSSLSRAPAERNLQASIVRSAFSFASRCRAGGLRLSCIR